MAIPVLVQAKILRLISDAGTFVVETSLTCVLFYFTCEMVYFRFASLYAKRDIIARMISLPSPVLDNQQVYFGFGAWISKGLYKYV